MKKSLTACLAAGLILGIWLTAPMEASEGAPVVMSIRERTAAVDTVTALRLERLLPKVMRESGIDMWIIPSNEDNYDPVFLTMIPYDAWCPITQILVFYDPGQGKDIERLNVSRTDMKGLHRQSWDPPNPATGKEGEEQWACLARIVRERNPRRIGINISGDIWAAGGLTLALHGKLAKALGPEYAGRLTSAEKACVLWLEILLDEDLDLYESAVAVSHFLIAETFSNQVITPGVTTVDDLYFHYRQRTADLGLDKSFRPSFSIRGRDPEMLNRYPTTDRIIRRGDLLHCDVGVKYLRYNTDNQELAYVLRRGEDDAPEGLKAGLAQTNRLQDIFCSQFEAGLTGNQILGRILAKAKAEGINTPRIYSHSVGLYLHEPGPLIGLPWEQVDNGPRGEVKLVPNSCFTVELSSDFVVPEWGGKLQRFPNEQDIVYTERGVFYLNGRQTKFHIIR